MTDLVVQQPDTAAQQTTEQVVAAAVPLPAAAPAVTTDLQKLKAALILLGHAVEEDFDKAVAFITK